MVWHAVFGFRSALLAATNRGLGLSFLLLLLVETGAFGLWLALPPFETNSPARVLSAAEDASGRAAPSSNRTRSGSAEQHDSLGRVFRFGVTRTFKTAVEVVCWFAVGALVAKGGHSISMTAASVVASLVILTVGRLARLGVIYTLGADPGMFDFAGLVSVVAPWAPELGRLSVFETWAAVVLAMSLSEAWERPFQLVLPPVLGVAALFMMVPSLREVQTWLSFVE